MNLQEQPTIQVELQLPVVFPLAKARERLVRGEADALDSIRLDNTQTPARASSRPTSQEPPADGEMRLTIESKPRRFYIATERLIEAGPTPGCSGCDNGTANPCEACRKRIADRVERIEGVTGE